MLLNGQPSNVGKNSVRFNHQRVGSMNDFMDGLNSKPTRNQSNSPEKTFNNAEDLFD